MDFYSAPSMAFYSAPSMAFYYSAHLLHALSMAFYSARLPHARSPVRNPRTNPFFAHRILHPEKLYFMSRRLQYVSAHTPRARVPGNLEPKEGRLGILKGPTG